MRHSRASVLKQACTHNQPTPQSAAAVPDLTQTPTRPQNPDSPTTAELQCPFLQLPHNTRPTIPPHKAHCRIHCTWHLLQPSSMNATRLPSHPRFIPAAAGQNSLSSLLLHTCAHPHPPTPHSHLIAVQQAPKSHTAVSRPENAAAAPSSNSPPHSMLLPHELEVSSTPHCIALLPTRGETGAQQHTAHVRISLPSPTHTAPRSRKQRIRRYNNDCRSTAPGKTTAATHNYKRLYTRRGEGRGLAHFHSPGRQNLSETSNSNGG